MAVGIIIGATFGSIVKSLVAGVIMPPIDLLLGNVDFTDLFMTPKEGVQPGPYATLAAAKEAGAVTINLGVYVNEVIAFAIVALGQGLQRARHHGRSSADLGSDSRISSHRCP